MFADHSDSSGPFTQIHITQPTVCSFGQSWSGRVLIPVYLELDDGHIAFFGRARMVGNTSLSGEGAAQKHKEQAAARGHQLL
jgi:hypothetical protein